MAVAGCGAEPTPRPETVSLLGEPLAAPEIPEEARARLESNLAAARTAYEADPADEDRILWLGRRLAYLGRYTEAIALYTEGISLHRTSYKLLRHRGHRLITLRRFDEAIADLEHAAELIDGIPDEVEPDGAPNPSNIPRSTSHFNIWYHLGLAYYLTGDWGRAAGAYRRCMTFAAVNDDMRCATSHWLYVTLRRLGRDEEAQRVLAPVDPEMEILESFAYHKLLLMYQGRGSPEELLASAERDGLEFATLAYGIGSWHRAQGDPSRAREIFGRIVDGPSWAAFGHIAAEADLAAGSRGSGAGSPR